MLQSLYIRNFALLDDVEVHFSSGLNIVTGETGAGKSMLIDALQVALGSRASADFIRSGREKATIQAAFDLSGLPWMTTRMEELGLDLDEDQLLMLSRDISQNGKNHCRVNGRLVSLSVYREVGSGLVDMLGQHEQQTLLNQDRHRGLLDRLGGQELLCQAQEVKEIYTRWREASRELKELQGNAREMARRLDMLQFQVAEIEKAELMEEEEEELLNERLLLVNAEKISRLAGEAYESLYGGEAGDTPAVESVGKAIALLRELQALDPKLEGLLGNLETALYQIEDASREISSYREQAEYNPERLDQIEHRLSLIKQLKYKYGSCIREILDFKESAGAEIERLSGHKERTGDLKAVIESLEQEWRQAASRLTKLRRKAAQQLAENVGRELKHLEMGGVEFKVGITEMADLSLHGGEEIEFLIAPNRGEPFRALQKIASGGELSRMMLALKVLLAGVDEVPTLIFDEVDTGVGGKALQAIGEKLAQIARGRQVICVTHAPQVACFADNHYLIRKEIVNGHTQTFVEALEQEQRVEELARMLAGREITEVVKNHAQQMLNISANFKK